MKKCMVFISFIAVALLALTACGGNDDNELVAAGRDISATQSIQANEQAPTAPADITLPTADPLYRIREHSDWIAEMMSEFSYGLGMTIDEIFDYVRAATTLDYGFDHGIEGGMDVSELAAKVGEDSVSFMNIVHMAYNYNRSVDVARRWADELDMNVHELTDYVFGGNDSHHLADALGVEWGEFQTVLAGVSNALWNERARAYISEESVYTASGWANELDMTFDEFIEYYNSFDRDLMSMVERLGVEPTNITLVVDGAIQFLDINE